LGSGGGRGDGILGLGLGLGLGAGGRGQSAQDGESQWSGCNQEAEEESEVTAGTHRIRNAHAQ
jgi:hypothetical protein